MAWCLARRVRHFNVEYDYSDQLVGGQTVSEQKYQKSALPDRPPLPIPDLDGVDPNTLSAWQRRVVLASQGWITQSRLTAQGGGGSFYLTLWAVHKHWHGTLGEVNLHLAANLGPAPWLDVAASEAAADLLARRLYDRAMTAWRDFPASVPCQGLEGELVESVRESEYFHAFPSARVVMPERALPTEDLPGWPGHTPMAEFLAADRYSGPSMMAEMLRLAQVGIDWRCSLDTYGRGSVAYGHLQRRWALASEVMLLRWHDTKLSVRNSRGLRPETPDLSSFGAARLVAQVRETVEYWHATYGPGQGLPPGCVVRPPDPPAPDAKGIDPAL